MDIEQAKQIRSEFTAYHEKVNALQPISQPEAGLTMEDRFRALGDRLVALDPEYDPNNHGGSVLERLGEELLVVIYFGPDDGMNVENPNLVTSVQVRWIDNRYGEFAREYLSQDELAFNDETKRILGLLEDSVAAAEKARAQNS